MTDSGPSSDPARTTLEQMFRTEYGRLVAALMRRFGDLDVAEDAASEALVAALEKWSRDGVPPNPGAWLLTTAKNRAIDRLRREAQREAKYREAMLLHDAAPAEPTGAVVDDQLRLMFICCHPVLSQQAQVALTLRLLGGLTVPEIAQAFFVTDTTMGQRITRAKKKIADEQIPFELPEAEDLPARLEAVFTVLFLIFNEGYLSVSEGPPVRAELSTEAIRLARLVVSLVPNNYEAKGLLALMLLTEARRQARMTDGMLVVLNDQDRQLWDPALIAEGHAVVRECLAHNTPGRYQILAAINAVHTDAPTAADTDWAQIVALYDQLIRYDPSPIVALNRAVAVAEVQGPTAALDIIGSLHLPEHYHAVHVARAELSRRLGRTAEARKFYETALQHTDNTAERAYLARRKNELG